MTALEQSLKSTATQIRDWQTHRNLSDKELCTRFAGLGSTKTYKKILDEQFDELNVERQEHNYRAAFELMLLNDEGDALEERDYEDLSHVTKARIAVTDALKETGNNRLVVIEGPSGAGKTTIARCLAKRWPNVAISLEADELWKDSPMNMLGAILRGLSFTTLINNSEGRKQKVLELLRARNLILIIDEAHHLGVRTLNMIKTILNETPVVIVFLAIPTLMRRLETDAYEESRQLMRNRLCERVHVNGPPIAEVKRFLTLRGLTFTDTKAEVRAAEKLAKNCTDYGHWNFISLVCRKMKRLAGANPIDEEQFIEALIAVTKSR